MDTNSGGSLPNVVSSKLAFEYSWLPVLTAKTVGLGGENRCFDWSMLIDTSQIPALFVRVEIS